MLELEDLPILAFERVVDFMDYASRRTCRLVSQKFKDYVDDTGLSIKLDSREPVSIELGRNVTATEARIFYMTSGDLLEADDIQTWKTVIISGPVDNVWLNDVMFRNCVNLRVLVLNDDALTSEDFEGKSIQYFHRLQDLHISLNHEWLSGSFQTFNPAKPFLSEVLYSPTRMTRVQKNMAYFLAIIRSRVLKYLYASVFDLRPSADSWENQPLFDFLQNHRQSLETVILPSLMYENPGIAFDFDHSKNPIQLKQVKLARSISEGNPNLCKRWINLIMGQYSLEKLAICLQVPETQPPLQWFGTLLSNNSKTLTHIKISLRNEILSTLDIRWFAVLDSLRSLKFSGSQKVTIINLNNLPTKSLTNLQLTSVTIADDFDGVKFLESFNPSSLHLYEVSADGYFKDTCYTSRFIKMLLRCRTLDDFNIWLADTADSYSPTAFKEVDESHFESYVAKLESLPNPAGFQISYREAIQSCTEGVTEPETFLKELHPYSSCMDFFEMLEMSDLYSNHREQPFHINRNADSYSIWVNPKTQAYHFLANTKSCSMRLKDIGTINISLYTVGLKQN